MSAMGRKRTFIVERLVPKVCRQGLGQLCHQATCACYSRYAINQRACNPAGWLCAANIQPIQLRRTRGGTAGRLAWRGMAA